MLSILLNKNILQNALKSVYSIIEKRNIIAILSNIKITISENKMVLEATDMDINVISVNQIEKGLEREVSFTVLGSVFYELIRKIQSDSIFLDLSKVEDNVVVITATGIHIELPCTSSSEFPTYEILRPNIEVKVKKRLLFNVLDQVKYAMCTNESYFYLNGVYLDYVSSDIVQTSSSSDVVDNAIFASFIATDAHRLAKSTIAIDNRTTLLALIEENKRLYYTPSRNTDKSFISSLPKNIMPKKAVYELYRLLEDVPEDIEIKIMMSDRHVSFDINNVTLISRVIDAQFPNYQAVLPVNNSIKIAVKTMDLINAVNLVTAVCSEKMKVVTFQLQGKMLTIKVMQGAMQNAMAKQELEIEYVGGDGFNKDKVPAQINIMLNPKYVLDCLNVIKTSKVVFCLENNDGGILVHQFDDVSSVHVLMPIKSQEE